MNRHDVIDLISLLQSALAMDESQWRPITEVCEIKKKFPHIGMIIGDYGVTKLSTLSFNADRDSLLARIEALEDKVGTIVTHTMPLFFSDGMKEHLKAADAAVAKLIREGHLPSE